MKQATNRERVQSRREEFEFSLQECKRKWCSSEPYSATWNTLSYHYWIGWTNLTLAKYWFSTRNLSGTSFGAGKSLTSAVFLSSASWQRYANSQGALAVCIVSTTCNGCAGLFLLYFRASEMTSVTRPSRVCSLTRVRTLAPEWYNSTWISMQT